MRTADGFFLARRMGGWLATGLGYAAVAALSRLGSCREWLETDLIHGHPVLTVLGLALGVAGADPWRSRWRWQSLLHGLVLGGCAWLAQHFLLHSDLLVRSERLHWTIAGILAAMLVGRFLLWRVLARQVFRFLLRRDPDGRLPLAILEVLLFGRLADPTASRRHPRFFGCLAWLHRIRRGLGFGGPHCHALERAFESQVDTASAALRAHMERGGAGPVDALALQLARAACTELRLHSLLRRAGPVREVPSPGWPARLVKVWELLGHAAARSREPASAARQHLLTGLAESAQESSWLRQTATLAFRCGTPSGVDEGQLDRALEPLSVRLRGEQSPEDLFGCLILIEQLISLNLPGWALDFLDAPGLAAAPASFRSALHWLRSAAETRLLAHEASLGQAETALHRARRDLALIGADAPELGRGRHEALLPTLREIPLPSAPRSTRSLAGLHRPGPDRSPGATVVILSAALAAIVAVLGWFGAFPPLLRAKVWQPLSGRVDVAAHPVAAAEASPDGSRVFLATLGGGLKELRADTFRLLSPSLVGTRPASLWLTDIAVSSAGGMAVQTQSAPTNDESPAAAGLEVSTANGWKQLIAPHPLASLEGDELRFVAALGPDKLLFTPRRWLLYRTARRELFELLPRDYSPANDGEVISAAGSTEDSGTAFLAVRPAAAGTTNRLLKLRVDADHGCEVEDVSPGLPIGEMVLQTVYAGGRVLARTTAHRLYERLADRWVMRLDGDTGLDLHRVAHALVSAGGTPALWLTERGPDGEVTGIRGRLLPGSGEMPPGPWHRRAIALGGDLPRLRLSPADPPPVAVFDAARGLHVLLVPAAEGSVCRFVLPSELPGSIAAAQLPVERTDTPGERVLSLDAQGDRLLVLLEATNGYSRRVIRLPVAAFLQADLGPAITLLHSVRPDAAVLGGSQILAALPDSANRSLYLFTDRGRMLTYHQDLHGFTTRQGIPLVGDDGAPLGLLQTVDLAGGRLLALDGRRQLWSGEIAAATSAELRLMRVHRASETRPASGLVPHRIATAGDTVDFFFGEPDSSLAWPWSLASGGGTLAATNVSPALLSWRASRLEHPLRWQSVGRRRLEQGLGDYVALDEAGSLCWRTAEGWGIAPDIASRYDRIVPAVGATFLGNSAGLGLLGETNGRPAEGEVVWPHHPAGLSLPISAAIGVKGTGTELWVGHATGLTRYSPGTQRWREEPSARSTNGPVSWEFLARADGVGAVNGMWAVSTAAAGADRRVFRIDGDSIAALPFNHGALPVTVGDGMAVLEPDGALVAWDPGLRLQMVLPPPDPSVGEVAFRRVVAGRRIFAVDQQSRLLAADPDRLQWTVFPTGKWAVGDVEIGGMEHPVITDVEGRVHRWTGDVWQTAAVRGDVLQKVGDQLAAINTSSGGFSLLDVTGQALTTPAGGSDPAVQVGDRITAMLADGDTLYLAGPRGAAFRPAGNPRMLPLSNGGGLERLEWVGGSLLGWRGPQAALLSSSDGQFQFSPLGNPQDSPVSSPQGTLWLARAGGGIAPVAGEGTARKPALLDREGSWNEATSQLAPWQDRGVLLAGRDSTLLYYDLATRNLRPVEGGARLGSGWRFVHAGPSLLLQAPTTAGLANLYQVAGSDRPSLELLDADCRSVIEDREGAAWISHRDRAVVQFVGQRVATGLPGLSAAAPAPADWIQVREAMADGESLWLLAGDEARQYDLRRREFTGRLPQVTHLARNGPRPLAVRKEGDARFTVAELGVSDPQTWGAFDQVAIGERSLLGWQVREGRRHGVLLGDSVREWQRRIQRPYTLANGGRAPVEMPGTGILASLSAEGEVIGYHPSRGEWTSSLMPDSGWTDLGRMGDSLVAVRPVERDSEVAWLPATGLDPQRLRVPGRAWFSSNAVVTLGAQTNGRMAVALRSPGLPDQPLVSFAPTTPPFEPSGCLAFASELLRSTLVLSRPSGANNWQALLVNADGTAQSATGFTLSTAPADVRVFATAGAWWVHDAGRLLRLDSQSGQTDLQNQEVLSVGWLGAELWCLCRHAESDRWLHLRRVHDGFETAPLVELRRKQEVRRITGAAFVHLAGTDCLQLECGPMTAEPFGPPETPDGTWPLPDSTEESGWQQGRLFLSANPTGFQPGVTASQFSAPLRGGLAGQPFQDGRLPVQGRSLLPDGWFADAAPAWFDSGTGWTKQVPLVMRDGSRRLVGTPQPVRPGPAPAPGRYELVQGELRDPATGARLGRPEDSAGVFACDQWRAAIPVGADGFLVLDALGQVWLWTRDEGEYQRFPVALPAGMASPAGFRLSIEDEGGILLMDGGAQTMARLDGRAAARSPATKGVTTPAERAGNIVTLAWQPRPTDNAAGLGFALQVGGSTSPLTVRFNSRGLDIDHPAGLVRLAGDRRLWLHLGNHENGQPVVSPAGGDGLHRLEQVRLAADVEPPPAPVPFSVGGFDFTPANGSWRVSLQGQAVAVESRGALSVDDIRSAATVTTEGKTRLFLLTAQPDVLVVQDWAGPAALGPPRLLSLPKGALELRNHTNVIHARYSGNRWLAHRNGEWQESAPNWQVVQASPGPWSFDLSTQTLSHGGEVVRYSQSARGFALEPDVLDTNPDPVSGPAVRPGDQAAVYYRSARGDWQIWRPGDSIGHRAAPAAVPPPTPSVLTVGNVQFPVRPAAADATYGLRTSDGQFAPLPLRLRHGRLPHREVVAAETLGSDALLCRLANGQGFVVYQPGPRFDWSNPVFHPQRPDPSPLGPPPAGRTSLALRPDHWLVWRREAESLRLGLSPSPDSTNSASLGLMQPDGLEIDQPGLIRPLLVANGRVEFAFAGARWGRNLRPDLAAFARLPAESVSVEAGAELQLPPGFATESLGNLTASGQFDSSSSFRMLADGPNRSGQIRLLRDRPRPVDLTVERDVTGWETPFAAPGAALRSADGLTVLGSGGSSLADWRTGGGAWSVQRLDPPLLRLWRVGDRFFGASSGGALGELKRDASDRWSTVALAVPDLPVTEFEGDAFSLRRTLDSGVLQPWEMGTQSAAASPVTDWAAEGLPASWPESVAWFPSGSVAVQQDLVLRRFETGSLRLNSPYRLAEPSAPIRLMRQLGELRVGGHDRPGPTVTEQEGGPGMQVAGRGAASPPMVAGGWQVSQLWPGSNVQLQWVGSGQSLDLAEIGRAGLAGGLTVDHATGLFAPAGECLLVTPGGVGDGRTLRLRLATDPRAQRLLAGPVVRLTREDGQPRFFSDPNSGDRVTAHAALASATATESPSTAVYLGGATDWQLSVTASGVPVLNHPVATADGYVEDILTGPQIFSGGQLAFDRVRGVHRHPDNAGDLVFVTPRATEKVVPGPAGAGSIVLHLGQPLSRPPRWHEVPGSHPRAAQILAAKDAADSLKPFGPLASTAVAAFHARNRTWLVGTNSLHWIEAGPGAMRPE
jgi:hypothetical protein